MQLDRTGAPVETAHTEDRHVDSVGDLVDPTTPTPYERDPFEGPPASPEPAVEL